MLPVNIILGQLEKQNVLVMLGFLFLFFKCLPIYESIKFTEGRGTPVLVLKLYSKLKLDVLTLEAVVKIAL